MKPEDWKWYHAIIPFNYRRDKRYNFGEYQKAGTFKHLMINTILSGTIVASSVGYALVSGHHMSLNPYEWDNIREQRTKERSSELEKKLLNNSEKQFRISDKNQDGVLSRGEFQEAYVRQYLEIRGTNSHNTLLKEKYSEDTP